MITTLKTHAQSLIRDLVCETQRFHTGHYPHPSRDGTRGFPLWLRTVAMNNLEARRNYRQAAQRVGCSTKPVR